MSSWIYLLSTFTPEALIFESLAILALICAYTAFWVLRKRKLGAVDNEVPASVVKAYLNELIGEAQGVRTQLFGLLGGESPITQSTGRVFSMQSMNPGPSADLAAFERKMAEQASALEKIIGEKAILERDLATARSAAPTGKNDGEAAGLREKLANLEARLQEYSIIEDDLANLKRLQQENAQLRAQLGGKAASIPVTTPTAPSPAAKLEAVAPPKVEPAPAADPVVKLEEHPTALEPAPTPSAGGPKITEDTPFATLNDDVKESLKAAVEPTLPSEPVISITPAAAAAPAPKAEPTPAPVVAAPAAPAPQAAPPAAVSNEKPPTEKSDEDLIAEFEKMLNS